MFDSLPANHDDYHGRAYGYASDRFGLWCRCRLQTPSRSRRGRRPGFFASRNLIFNACFLHLYGPVPNLGGESFRETASKTERLSCGRTFLSRLTTTDSRNCCIQFCPALLTFRTVFFSVVGY